MKKTIIILIACCTLFSGHAQYQSIFGQNSTSWEYNYWDYWVIRDQYRYTQNTTGKDTLINGLLYSEIYQVTVYGGVKEYFLLREDTTTGSVFKLDTTKFAKESMLMNMALAKGDTFAFDMGKPVVDSVYYDSVGRKVIQFDYLTHWNPDEKMRFIEGVGVNAIKRTPGIIGYGIELLCSYKDGLKVYMNNYGHSCSVFTIGLHESMIETVKIYPNPAKEFIQVEMDLTKAAEFEIYATTGKLVLSGSISPENRIIDLSGLSNGLYLLKVENSFVKLVKTN